MMEENKIETLASICRRTIANNIDRYPAEYFGSLSEMEWEEIVRVKYRLTAPKVQVQKVKGSNLLSDGRKFPVFAVKFIQEVEEKNEHLRQSEAIDELVWKDCVDFKFKQGGPSRPLLFREPWVLQVGRIKSIVEEIQKLSINSECSYDNDGSSIPPYRRTVIKIIKDLQRTAMTVPLLSASGIGKGIKKLIKKIRGVEPELTAQLETLLQNWMDIASAQGVVAISKSNKKTSPSSKLSQVSVDGKNRHTSDEQHAQDIKTIQQCPQWRNLFQALSEREKKLFKSHGEKMRRIRQTLEVGRPKISTARTKNNKILKSTGGLHSHNNGSNPVRKLGKLRQDFNTRNALIKGGRASVNTNLATTATKSPSFGSSVSSAMGSAKKRPSTTAPSLQSNKQQKVSKTSSSWKRSREVILNDGKKMKLPKVNSRHMNRRF